MKELLIDTEFWKAITGFAFPLAIIVVALMFRKIINGLLSRENVTIKVAGMELSVAEAAAQSGKMISEIQERLAALENKDDSGVEKNSEKEAPAYGEDISILWVDDFPTNNAFLIERLEQEGIRIRKEISTDAGLAALASDSFTGVISDLGRIENGKDNPFAGLEFTRAAREAGYKSPILIFAGPRGLENKGRLLAAGANKVTASAVEVFQFVNNLVKQP